MKKQFSIYILLAFASVIMILSGGCYNRGYSSKSEATENAPALEKKEQPSANALPETNLASSFTQVSSSESTGMAIIPTRSILAAGTIYEAKIAFFDVTKSTVLNFKWKQLQSKVFNVATPIAGSSREALFQFRATGGYYDKDGTVNKSLVAAIEFKDQKGRTKIMYDTIPYFVEKPVINVFGASLMSLYLNCGNKVKVLVPALGKEYNPSFGVTGAQRIMGKTKGDVTIVPVAPKVVLSVSSGGVLVGKQIFRVKKIPLPSVHILSSGRKVNLKTGFIKCPRSLTFKAIPDASFKEFLPADSRYQVTEGSVELVRGKAVLAKAKIINGKSNLTSLIPLSKPGDRLLVDIKKVVRKNFQGKTETVRGLGALVYNIPIVGADVD